MLIPTIFCCVNPTAKQLPLYYISQFCGSGIQRFCFMGFDWHHLVTSSWCLGWSGGLRAALLTHLVPLQAEQGPFPSPCSLMCLHQSIWTSDVWQVSAGACCRYLMVWAPKWAQHYFHCILLVRAVSELSQNQGNGTESSPLNGKACQRF